MDQNSVAVPLPPSLDRTSPELDRSFVRGIAWTGLVKSLTQFLRWGCTLLIARLLSPSDYGLVGMATIYLGLIQLVNELGLGMAIVQQRALTQQQIARLGGLSVVSGAFFLGLTAVLAGPIASFFGQEELKLVVVVLSSVFVLRSLQVVPKALLTRDLHFKQLAWVDGLEAISLAICTLAFALAGAGYWALIFGSVLGALLSTVVTLCLYPHRLAWPSDLATLRGPLALGWRVIWSRIAWYTYSNADFAVVGRLLGPAALGAYTVGWSLASIPVDRVTAMVGSVTPGVFSSVQNDPAALRRYVLRLTEGIAVITFPLSIGLALVAEEFVLLVLGEAWTAAILPLRLLSFYAAFRSLTPLMPQVLMATGHAHRAMWSSVFGAVLLPVLFVIGSRWGTTGVSMAWIVGFPVVAILGDYRSAFRVISMPVREYLACLRPAADATLAMSIGVMALRAAMPPLYPLPLRLAAAVAVGAGIYAATLHLLHGERIVAYRSLLRQVRG